MKDIHPKLVDCKVTCACGATFTTKSTVPEFHAEVCDKCHSFYTGKQQAKRTGTVEKFNKKFGLNQDKKAA